MATFPFYAVLNDKWKIFLLILWKRGEDILAVGFGKSLVVFML